MSMAIFVGAELALGMVVGELIVGRYASLSLRFMLQGVLNLTAYFVGGVLIGLVSPGIRIKEPAVGAFLSVSLMLALTLFTPYGFLRFSTIKLVVGGAIAFCLAFTGAKIGERLVGNRV